MKMNAYSVFDVKAGVYGTPFFTHNDGMAIRMFQQVVEDKTTSVSRFPADYSLFRLASFDDGTAVFDEQKAIPIAQAIQFVRVPEEVPFFLADEEA